jgi:hypothetical protein
VSDNVNHPAHYNSGGIEAIDGIAAATVGLDGIEAVCTGNAIKYLWRWKRKGGVEDLRKAKWYIDRLIAEQPATLKEAVARAEARRSAHDLDHLRDGIYEDRQ